MITRIAAVLSLLLLQLSPSLAGPYWTPQKDTPERKAVMDAARVPVEKDLGQAVIFRVEDLRVTDDWAFLNAEPLQPNGRPIDFSRTAYRESVADGSFGGMAAVLLARAGDGWRVVTYSVGFSDLVWDTWDDEYGAPSSLFP